MNIYYPQLNIPGHNFIKIYLYLHGVIHKSAHKIINFLFIKFVFEKSRLLLG